MIINKEKYNKWQGEWEKITSEIEKNVCEKRCTQPHPLGDQYHLHTLEILRKYTDSLFVPLDFGFEMNITSCIFGFFKGHWRHHHKNEVIQALDWYYAPSAGMVATKAHALKFTVPYILKRLKSNIKASGLLINSAGDLRAILTVIKKHTGVDYDELDEQQDQDILQEQNDKNSSDTFHREYHI